MTKQTQAVTFPDAGPYRARHICAFFNGEDEEYSALLPFISDGFACGHKAVHIVSPDRRERHIGRLAAAGIDISGAQDSGQLKVSVNTDVYLSDGKFDQDRMIRTFESIADRPAEGSFPLSRIVCQMEWASQHPFCIDDLIEFEARVNDVWDRHDDTVICVYDLTKFSGDVVMDMIRTHPLVIIGGVLQHNPFFVPPAEFLQELRQRRARQTSPQESV